MNFHRNANFQKTGASLQVATEMLSNSTEKPVTISTQFCGCFEIIEICFPKINQLFAVDSSSFQAEAVMP
jgi:hypothetical protein